MKCLMKKFICWILKSSSIGVHFILGTGGLSYINLWGRAPIKGMF